MSGGYAMLSVSLHDGLIGSVEQIFCALFSFRVCRLFLDFLRCVFREFFFVNFVCILSYLSIRCSLPHSFMNLFASLF